MDKTFINGTPLRPENTFLTVRTLVRRQAHQDRLHKPANDNGRIR